MASVIHVLSRQVADRIAAGEVVERPASVVKELLENALDAGATHLQLDLEEGGTRLLRVTDNGDGMSSEDLELCVLPHATSKIQCVEDLFKVASFGFRGEALPSIASISELSILTRRKSDEVGAKLVTRGGEPGVLAPAGAPVGTTVEVRNLFFNVPARKKFLKAERTEFSACLEMVTRLLLPEPALSIIVTHNGKKALDIRPAKDVRARIGAFFGEEMARRLRHVTFEDEGLRVEGYVGPPGLTKGTSRHQLLFLNGRFIKDRGLLAAIREAYRGLIMPKDYPVAYLFLELDPARVDVNVHPTKTEVRFREKERVFSGVHRALRATLVEDAGRRPLVLPDPLSRERITERGESVTPPAKAERGNLLETLERELFPSGIPARVADDRVHENVTDSSATTTGSAPVPATARQKSTSSACGGPARPMPVGDAPRFLQVHRSYVIAETPEGFGIIDQHALHERRLYEELLVRFANSEGEDQHLLIPDVVELSAADQALILSVQDLLEDVGIRVEPFGGTSVCIRSYPALLSRVSGGDVLEDVLKTLRESERVPRREELLKDLAASLSCRAAVKFNDALPAAELAALLSWYRDHPEARNCPHGRPVALHLTLEELEQRFDRKK